MCCPMQQSFYSTLNSVAGVDNGRHGATSTVKLNRRHTQNFTPCRPTKSNYRVEKILKFPT